MAVSVTSTEAQDGPVTSGFWGLTLGSIGVVFGDIGTSPLYAFREAVAGAAQGQPVSRAIVLGVLSLILWALFIVVTAKYVLLLLRADNNGEGGTLSLMALGQGALGRRSWPLLALGVIGASMFIGDSMITPAISVLSAVEGLKLAAPALEHYVVPLTVFILVVLFSVQSGGTARVASAFGPVMIVWFATLAVMGLVHISDDPSVLAAINPWYGIHFLLSHGTIGLVTLGAVFLAVTGGEALYADLGHFGRKPIQAGWLYFVLPSLLINYFGQGALVLSDPTAIENSFYRMVPEIMLLPLVVLATAATVIVDASGRAAWSAATLRGPLHLRVACRADLFAAREPVVADRRLAAGAAVPYLERAGVGLWYRRLHNDGGRWDHGFRRDLEAVELARSHGGGADCSVCRRRHDFLQCESFEIA
jgi:KUP system potassium uptake protein